MQLDRTRPEEECSRQAVGLQGVAEAGEEHTRRQVLRARVDSRREEDQEALKSKEARKESKFLNSGRETNNAPFIRVNYPANALTADQKAKLAPLLVEALISQEIDPVTDIGRAATALMFNEIDPRNCFPGGLPLMEHPEKPFWIVEILGDDGSVLDETILPKAIFPTWRHV
jgi:phenylpyruvate tautomerase PptA (4-oxalocrotonate tautomerase family)